MKLKTYHDYIFFSLVITIFIIFIFIILYSYNLFRIPACFFITKLGIYCPACGATRAFIYFLDYNIISSIYYNPIILYCIVTISIYLFIYLIIKITHKNEQILSKYGKTCFYIGIFISIFNCIIKNILLHVYNISL